MSFVERIFHAILFEVLAVLLSVTAVVVFTEHSAGTSTFTIVIISLIAMLWNFLFNWAFDRVFTGNRENRGVAFRLFHTFLFEGGLLIFTIPVVAYFMQVSWWEAFLLDLAMTILIMCYTFVFNWVYDHLRLKFIKAKQAVDI